MTIQMLDDYYDGKRKIFSKDEIIKIDFITDNLLYAKTKWGFKYCLNKTDENKYYIIKEK